MRGIKDTTQAEAEQIAEQRYGQEFNGLPKPIQHDVWCEAESRVREKAVPRIFGHGGLLWDIKGYIRTCWLERRRVPWRDYCEWRDM